MPDRPLSPEAQDYLRRFQKPAREETIHPPQALYHFTTYGPVINMPASESVSLGSVLKELGYSQRNRDRNESAGS